MNVDRKKIIISDGSKWTFRGNISKLFDKHIAKSLPLYHQVRWLCLEIADHFLKDNSVVYDLGCSTGTFLKSLQLKNHKRNKIHYIGIDVIPEMVNYARKLNRAKNVKYEKKDLINAKFKKSDLIFSFYTLQFIDLKNREKILRNIYKSLNVGGAFILSEKIFSASPKNQSMNNEIYTLWKLNQGFSKSEVINKSQSLRGVLNPYSSKENIELLKKSGFKNIEVITKYLNFETILAIK